MDQSGVLAHPHRLHTCYISDVDTFASWMAGPILSMREFFAAHLHNGIPFRPSRHPCFTCMTEMIESCTNVWVSFGFTLAHVTLKVCVQLVRVLNSAGQPVLSSACHECNLPSVMQLRQHG